VVVVVCGGAAVVVLLTVASFFIPSISFVSTSLTDEDGFRLLPEDLMWN
jgi:hypothetical protein